MSCRRLEQHHLCLRAVRQRRVVQDDHHAAVGSFEVAESLVHRGDGAVLVGEVDVALCDANVALLPEGTVDELHLTPTLDSETRVFWVLRIATYKIGQCTFARRAEGLAPTSQRRLEEHWPVFVSIGGVDDLSRQRLRGFEALSLVGLGDADQGVPPTLLGSQYFCVRDGCRRRDPRGPSGGRGEERGELVDEE